MLTTSKTKSKSYCLNGSIEEAKGNPLHWDKFSLFLNKYPLPSPRIKVNIYDLRKEISYIL